MTMYSDSEGSGFESDSDNSVNLLHPLEHRVDDNEGPSPANSGTAVSNYWTRVRRVQHMDPRKTKNYEDKDDQNQL